MKKKVVLPILFSLSSVLVVVVFTLTSGRPARAENTVNVSSTFSLSPEEMASLPLNVPAERVEPLEELQDSMLQSELDRIVASDSHWAQLSKNKSLSVGVVDMQDPLNARYAAVNGNHMMYAASLPKIAVLLASEDAIHQGKIEDTPEVEEDMRLMIAKSSNSAASRMIERVGIDHISKVLQDPCYRLYDKQTGGGLWVGKPYGSSQVRIGDPLKNLSHAASALQVSKYYYMLAFGQLVSREGSRHMLGMLANPELHHKFVSVLDKVAPAAQVFRKSGTWANWHADSVLVWDKTRRYIVVALANDGAGETILRELMQQIDDTLTRKG